MILRTNKMSIRNMPLEILEIIAEYATDLIVRKEFEHGYVEQLCNLNCDMVVKLCIADMNKTQYKKFSQNENDKAVELHTSGKFKIARGGFSRNENPLAVKYCLAHPWTIVWHEFNLNENDKAVEACISNEEQVNEEFFRNENDKAVIYCIAHSYNINLRYFSENKNSLAVNWCINSPIGPFLKTFSKSCNPSMILSSSDNRF